MESKSAFLFKFLSNSEIVVIIHIISQGLRNGRGWGLEWAGVCTSLRGLTLERTHRTFGRVQETDGCEYVSL